jgi:hypothetical protein
LEASDGGTASGRGDDSIDNQDARSNRNLMDRGKVPTLL